MKKLELKDRIAREYFTKTGRSDGWEVWEQSVGTMSQEALARKFGVSLRTSAIWHKEYRELQNA